MEQDATRGLGDQDGGMWTGPAPFKNKSQKPEFHQTGIYNYQEKTALGFCDCFSFGSVASTWLLTSKHKAQEGLNILQVGHCLATPRHTV